jgi:tight adherence protein B
MNIVDLVTVGSFVCVLLFGCMLLIVSDLLKARASVRISARMKHTFVEYGELAQNAKSSDTSLFKVTKQQSALIRWMDPKLRRLNTVAGRDGKRIVLGATFVAGILALLVTRVAPLPSLVVPVLLIGLPVLAAIRSYQILVARFRHSFLQGLPDVIDLIVRAVRAGVPVTHVITTVANECPQPLAREFKLMGDSLQVGLDLEEVLQAAMQRIQIADFSFFCVCLLLQRETGGQLGETLENLAQIVRTRREIRQKTRALTGEARITTKILSAIPVVIVMSMYMVNRPYIMILFNKPAGQKLLTFAVASIVVGIFVINKISRLDTSR